MYVLRSYSGIRLASVNNRKQALQYGSQMGRNVGCVCEIWFVHPDHFGGVEELLVTFRGPSAY
jgi:hypothetical protein